MKYREILLALLKTQPFFDKKIISQLSEQFGLKNTTVDSYISRSLARKDIFLLKNGLYITADFYHKNKGEASYLYYLANILRTPSYVSSWTALQHYNLTTEVIHTIISVTPKVTRSYQTKVGNFIYQSIQQELFTDFSLIKEKFNFFMASPAKALFDLLYFKTRQFRGVRREDLSELIAELRVDFDEMNNVEQKKFFLMVKKYLH